ncbi:hypothetical protein B1748_25585 [Paenibacillus sp. MY03]|jgi:hypothetical protein|uniref:Uncharacterized protein n=1 Tax=Paenibacillus agaridevorans TaxID=171404 RepID=A0A2R5ETP5_9BACL|nr:MULTISPECIES: hypothetical protein [Paenibacillus]OUS71881.1 hypothetical protein B1748_25585 [Paenibacillus sp. MY03]QNK59751.1 hypothetical protein H7F31_13335 [Paenibacillus sp. PAMC21692]GBG06771.1 hypothetical protein PAT3040_01309 [Paenibacillus agaridevorans]
MTTAKIPYGDKKVTVELTIKELQALAGIRFHANHEVEVSARKKLNMVLEGTYERESRDNAPIPYQLLS